MGRDPSFSLNNFKNWMSKNSEFNEFFGISNHKDDSKPEDELIGCEVYSKLGSKKIMEKMNPEEGDLESLAEDFMENGGMVLAIDGKNMVVEVECGSFSIPRFCVKVVKS